MASKKKSTKTTVTDDEPIIQDERYRLLFETSHDAIMFLDTERFFDCNPATLKMFGLTKEIFIRLHPSEISPPRQPNGKKSREEADRIISEAFEKGKIKFDWVHRRSNGEDFPVTVWLTAFQVEGKSVLQATVRELSPIEEAASDLEAHRLKLQLLLDDRSTDYRKVLDERMKAEGELKRLIKAVETSFNAIALFGMEMNFVYANQAFCRMAAIESGDIGKFNARDFIPDESLSIIQEQIQKNIDGQEAERFEVKSHDSKGKELWVEIAGSVLFNELGEPDGLLAIINDITERRRFQGILLDRSKILEAMSEAIISFAPGGIVTDVNPAYERMTGFSRSDVIGKNGPEIAAQIIEPKTLPIVLKAFQRVVSGEKIPPMEVDIKRKDGRLVRIIFTTTSVGGGPIGSSIIAVLQDISLIKKAQEALRESEEKFKTLVERSLDGILIIQDGKVAYMNPALLKLSGYSMEEQFGRDFIENVAPEARKSVLTMYHSRMNGKNIPQIYETTLLTKYGARVPMEVNAGVMDYQGRPADFVYLRDLSERKMAEKDVRIIKEHFEYVLGVTNTGFDLIDEDFNVVYVDPKWVEKLGDYSGRKCYEYFMSKSDVCETCAIPKALKTGENVVSEEYLAKEKRYIEVHTIPLKGEDGRKLVAEFNIDITDRKIAEENLKNFSEQLKSLSDNLAHGMVYQLNVGSRGDHNDLRITYISPVLENLHGLKPEDTIKNPMLLYSQIVEEDRNRLMEAELNAFAIMGKMDEEVRVVLPSGEMRWRQFISAPRKLPNGDVIWDGIELDVTERKMADEKLRALTDQLKGINENLADGMVYQINGGKDGKNPVFTYLSPAVERMRGIKLEDALANPQQLYDQVVEEDRELMRKIRAETFAKREKMDMQLRIRLPDGQVKWHRFLAVPSEDADGNVIWNGIELDITDENIAERALRENEIKYRTLTEKANDAIFLADAETGILVDVNQKASELTGLTREELIGMHQSKLHPPGEVKKYKEIFKKHVKDGSAVHEDIFIIHKDGRKVPVSISASVFELQGKRVNQGIFHDLTERINAENALREADEKISTIFSSMEDLVFGFDKNGKFISCHTPVGGLLYMPEEMFIGKKYSDVMPPHVSKLIDKAFQKNMKRESMEFEYSLSLGGKDRFFSAKISPIFMKDEFNGAVAVVRDITVRMQTEQELLSSREQLNALFQASTNGIGVEKDGKLFFVNPSFISMFGYSSPEDVIGQPLNIIVGEKDKKRVKGYSKLRLKGEAPPKYEFTGVRMDGSTFDAEASVSTYKIGDEDYFVGFVQDITERKQSLKKMQESEARFRNMAENIHDGLTIIENGKVSYINERAVEIYGYPKDELMYKSQMDLVIPEDREQLHSILENARSNNQRIGELEFWVQGKDGSRRYVRTRLSTSGEGSGRSEFIITTDITARKIAEDETKRRMMKFLLEDGRMYMVKEFRSEMSVEAFNDLLNLEYFGMVMSRTPKKDVAKVVKGVFEYLWLGDRDDGKELFDEILAAVSELGGKSAILIERLDYLVFKYGFKETMTLIYRLRDIVYLKEQIVILSLDPSTMAEDQLSTIQKEMGEIELRQTPKPPEELLEIAQVIYDRNSTGIKPSFSEVGEQLKMSKPTCRKRVRRLIAAGYATEVSKGNRKVLELTQKGRSLFFK